VADLADQDTRIAEAAARALGKLGDATAVPGLVSALESGHPARFAFAEALGNIADPAAVPALVSALNDLDGTVRATAAIALGDIGDPIALAPLEKLFSDDETYSDHALHEPGTSPRISSAAREASARIKTAQALKTIHFSAYYPKETAPNVWQAAHVYLFGIRAADLVAADL